VDARDKPGHDELLEMPDFIGHIFSQPLRMRLGGVLNYGDSALNSRQI
jgi:hypothetical protein